MSVRVYRRKVMARRASRAEAETIAASLAEGNPEAEYAVEYTSVVNQREQWRVIYVDAVPEGTPDVNPRCESIRTIQRDAFHEAWQSGDEW